MTVDRVVLERDEYLRKLEGIALKAAGLISLPGNFSIKLINHTENSTFFASNGDRGDRVIVRVYREGYHSLEAICSEHLWMNALREDEVIHVPAVLLGSDGETIRRVKTAQVPEGRVCTLFEFVEGDSPDEQNLVSSFSNLGQVTAKMHKHTQGWKLPITFERYSWDIETIFGENAHWGRWSYARNLNDERINLLDRLVQVVSRRLEIFGKEESRFGLIHADMRLDNLLIHKGENRVIDFDDCGFSWFLFDLATALTFIEDSPEVPQLISTWLEGYRLVKELSQIEENEIPTFMMLRRMQVMGWMGSHAETELALSLGGTFTDVTCNLAESYLKKFG